MSNDEIPVGSRWLMGDTEWTITGPANQYGHYPCASGADEGSFTPLWIGKGATRIDAPPAWHTVEVFSGGVEAQVSFDGALRVVEPPPAVKVGDWDCTLPGCNGVHAGSCKARPEPVRPGDIVRDPALLRPGMRVEWACTSAECRDSQWWRGGWALDKSLADESHTRAHGVRILALPEPAKAEVPCDACKGYEAAMGKAFIGCPECTPLPSSPPPARCAPSCSPAAPCYGAVCPVRREPDATFDAKWFDAQHGIAADPPARRHTPPTLRSDGLCIAGWDGREGRK